MTQQRRDNNSTEFGIWLRQQPEIDSKKGYVATNIDFLWMNYLNNKWMLIEEKRYGRFPSGYQVQMYKMLDQVRTIDKKYCGFHVLVFENTSPNDGGIYLDGRFITSPELINFLKFTAPENWYESWFPKRNIVGIKFTNIYKQF